MARLFDADGAIVAIKPDDVKWEINDPWIRENMMPCKGANGPPPPGIEFGPIKRGYTDATLGACFQGAICQMNPNPPPPVWRKVSAGLGHHACALKMDGRAYCWGQGGHGELGVSVPADCVETFHGGGGTACLALRADSGGGAVRRRALQLHRHQCRLRTHMRRGRCAGGLVLGGNFIGKLGIGTDDDDGIGYPQPQKVLTTQKFTAIMRALDFTCGLTTTHDVYCWGYNRNAVVPHIPDTMLTVPTLVNLLVNATSIDADGRMFARLAIT